MNVAQIVDLVIADKSGLRCLYSGVKDDLPSNSPLRISRYIVKLQNGQAAAAVPVSPGMSLSIGDFVLIEYLEDVRQYAIIGKLPRDIVMDIITDINTNNTPEKESLLSNSVVLSSTPPNSNVTITPEAVQVSGPAIALRSNSITNRSSSIEIVADNASLGCTKCTVSSSRLDVSANRLVTKADTLETATSNNSIITQVTNFSSDNLVLNASNFELTSTRNIFHFDSLAEFIATKVGCLASELLFIADKWCSIKTKDGYVVRSFADDLKDKKVDDIVSELATDQSAVLINKDTLDKINELVDKVNELQERVYKLEMFIKIVFPQYPSTTLTSPMGPVTMTAMPSEDISPTPPQNIENLEVDNCLSSWLFSESKKNKKSSE